MIDSLILKKHTTNNQNSAITRSKQTIQSTTKRRGRKRLTRLLGKVLHRWCLGGFVKMSSADRQRGARQKMLRRDMAYPRNGNDLHGPRVQYAWGKRETLVRWGRKIKLVQEEGLCTLILYCVSQRRVLLINCFVNTFSAVSWMSTFCLNNL